MSFNFLDIFFETILFVFTTDCKDVQCIYYDICTTYSVALAPK